MKSILLTMLKTLYKNFRKLNLLKLLLSLKVIIIFYSTGCTREVTYDLPILEKELVINSVLISDSILTLHVFSLSSFGESMSRYSYDGDLVLSSSDGLIDTLAEAEMGYYYSSEILQKEKHYFLSGNSSNYPMSSNDSLPNYPHVSKIVRLDTAGFDTEGYPYAEATISLKDYSGKDFYEIKITLLTSEGKKKTLSLFSENDEIVKNEGLPFLLSSAYPFSDEMFDDTDVEISFNYYTPKKYINNVAEELYPSYSLIVEVRKTSERYYHYRKSLILHEQGKWPDFWNGMGNPNNLYSNITGGYGIFAAYSSIITEIKN